jgi:hypothetical protein
MSDSSMVWKPRMLDPSKPIPSSNTSWPNSALVEAAQKACSCEEKGQTEEAETWRHIEAALKSMRGPHVS